MTKTMPSRRIYIDHDPSSEGIVLRRVPVYQPARPAVHRESQHASSAALLLSLGRLVRGRMVRRIL